MAKLSVIFVIFHSCLCSLSLPASLQPGSRSSVTDEIIDEIERADSIMDVLAILYPSLDPYEAWQTLQVVEGSSSAADGRFGLGRSDGDIETRPATQGDLEEMRNQETEDKCRTPVDLTIDAYDELNIVEGFGEIVFPDCAMVPRCSGDAGCCGTNEKCQLKVGSTVQVEKMFLLMSTDNTEPPRVAIKNITAHTECECVPHTVEVLCSPRLCDSPMEWNPDTCSCECPQRCPSPFLQDADSCVCDCLNSNKQCGKVKRGLDSLSPGECECVSTLECALPRCKNGYFVTAQCKCISRQ